MEKKSQREWEEKMGTVFSFIFIYERERICQKETGVISSLHKTP